MNTFRSTRIISSYGSESELHYLVKENRYIWMRPKVVVGEKTKMKEVVLVATNDYEAQQEVANIVNREMWGCP
jgi:hypothetical protein